MSGVFGKLSFERDETLARPVLDQMLDALSAGPQERRAIHVAPGIALGVCAAAERAAIGSNENGDVHVVADGQITNAALLRGQLERLGHRFRGRADSEVIAHAFEEWKVRGLARLRGRFVCAIWCERERRLIVARDHLGIRPMYFAVLQNHGVVVASRISALLHDPGIGRQPCPLGIDAYLALGYIPAPLTPYQRISKLEPAEALVVEGRRFHVERYWEEPAATPLRREQAQEALAASVGRVVRHQIKHDPRPALLYSGGTASAYLLASSPRSLGPVITVAVEQNGRELTRSDAAAARLGRMRELESAAHQMAQFAMELTAQVESPLADPLAVVQFAICARARRHAEVALAGHGLEWGGNGEDSTTDGSHFWDGEQRRGLYTRHFAWQVREGDPMTHGRDTFLPDSVLAAADTAAVAAGLDLRFPYLDVEFIEAAATARSALTRRGNALRRLLRMHLPASLMPPARRADLHHSWLRVLLPSMVPGVLLNRRFDERGIISLPTLARLWDEHRLGRRDHTLRLWSLLVLEFWFRHFIDGDAAAEPLEYAVLKAA